jgi:hypothetical protein
MSIAQLVTRVTSDLTALRVPHALVGGLALAVRAEPRFTSDVDMAIAVQDDSQAERVVFELRQRGYEVLAVLDHKHAKRLSTVRLRPPDSTDSKFIVDLLFASCGIEPEIVAAAEPVRVFPQCVVSVARREHLLVMKLLAHDEKRRPQDRVDAIELLRRCSASELEAARLAARRVQELGFARDKDLLRELEELRRFLAEP